MTGSRRHAGAPESRTPRNPALIITFLAVLLSLFGPALTAGALADPGATPAILDTREASGTMSNDQPVTAMEATEESTEGATEAATEEATETATEEATDVATEEPTETVERRITTLAATGTVVVEQHTCSVAVTNPALVSYSDLSTTYCLESIAPVSFTVSDGAGYASTLAASPTSWGQTATFADVPATTITITQAVPPGYENPVVFCREFGTAAPGSYALQPVTGSSVSWPLVTGSEVHCAFFSEPTGEDDTGGDPPSSTTVLDRVDARKYACPAGFDADSSLTSFSNGCITPLGDVTFTLTDANGTRSLATDADYGLARFFDVAVRDDGTVGLVESVPAGYGAPIVFCHDDREDNWIRQTVVDNGVTIESSAAENNALSCYFFNIPTGDSGDGPDSGSGMVRLHKYTCPAGVERSDDDYLLSEQCDVVADPVDFTVAAGDSYDETQPLTGTSPLSAVYYSVPFGAVTITEAIPAGYGEPLAFCTDVPADGPGAYEPIAVSGGSISVDHRAEAELPLTCLFFNFPAGDDEPGDSGTVHVSKYTCPAGVERSDDDYLLSEQCREEIDPVSFTVVATAGGYDQTVTASPGVPQSAIFEGVPYGEIAITESIPTGYGHPLVFCSDTAADGPGAYEPVAPWPESGAFIVEHRAEADIELSCVFFNFPDEDPGNTVTVNKFVCPSWVNPETDRLLDACAPGGDGIPFTFVDGNGRHPAAVSGGTVSWTDVVIGVEGELQIIEEIPSGYGDPWVICDGILMASTNGFVVPNPGDARPFHVECDWFNFALEDATLAVVKHTCAPGYDLDAAGADPMADCPELTNGVDFRIAGMGADMTSTTGDAGDGMVRFGGLDPGGYTLTETVPDGTAASFVLDCYGNDVGAVRPSPLAMGDTLDLTVHAGEDITCHWFNVPEVEGGELVVVKYLCSGAAFESEVDCEIYEDGASFDLAIRRDGAWVDIETGTTDDHGTVAWTGLEPGRYWLGERDGEWCHIASERLDEDLTGITVAQGQKAIVRVYNCGATPGQPGETPTRFPDTGVPPDGGGESFPAAALAGLLALSLSRRRVAAMAVTLAAIGAGRTVAQDGEQVIEPLDGSAEPEAAPTSLCLPSSGDRCERGPVPAGLRITAIGVDAPVEILETVAGEMQQPTDETHVAWYKETARLGETGNMLLAGHLNWWGVPEAVFYRLDALEMGDEIVVEDAEGNRWVYAVEWVREMSSDEPPGEEVLGMTAWPAVTLVTCGGAWNSASSEYDARTVVRANQVEAIPAGAAT